MNPIIVGHRGLSSEYPENTLVSIEAAFKLGLKWVEVDVQPTQDGHLVVCHDHTLERCSNGVGRVDQHTLASLRCLDFGSWFSSRFAGEPIPTLAELLELAKRYEANINIEIKLDDQHNIAQVVEQLAFDIKNSDIALSQLLFSSFSASVMRALYRHSDRFRLGVLSEQLSADDLQLLLEVDAFSCHLDQETVTEAQIVELRRLGYQVWCYTVNDQASLEHCGCVDAIFTDYPARFL
jgi:glycerophosphoryl diester phosphodiesterase